LSAIVERAIVAAGLEALAAARRSEVFPPIEVERLRGVDLLALGALADRVRRDEVGDEVRIYAPPPADEKGPAAIVFPRDAGDLTGLELLREVAIARVSGPRGARIRVTWTRCGLELAQVALGFGANELAGYIADKRGLPIADGQLAGVGKMSKRELAHDVKMKELAGFVRSAGRQPVFA
jgi:hypothetical protein